MGDDARLPPPSLSSSRTGLDGFASVKILGVLLPILRRKIELRLLGGVVTASTIVGSHGSADSGGKSVPGLPLVLWW